MTFEVVELMTRVLPDPQDAHSPCQQGCTCCTQTHTDCGTDTGCADPCSDSHTRCGDPETGCADPCTSGHTRCGDPDTGCGITKKAEHEAVDLHGRPPGPDPRLEELRRQLRARLAARP